MADCSLAITIDGWQADGDVAPTFRVGDAITGTVLVWVTEEVRCNGLDVRLELIETEKGYTLPAGPPPARIFSGTWQPGEYQYRFELPSRFPPTHHGSLVGWRWIVKASADIPWASDPEGESPFMLERAPGNDELTVLVPPPDGVEPGATSTQYGALVAVTIGFVLALVTLGTGVVLHAAALASDDVSGAIASLGTMGTIGTGVALVSLWWRRRTERGSANRFRASVTLEHAARGAGYRTRSNERDGVDCEVRTRSGGVIERVVAEIVVREYVRWTEHDAASDSSRQYEYEKVLSRAEVPLAGDSAKGSWRGRLPLPEPGPEIPPYTMFDEQGRGLVWQVNVLSYATGRTKPDVETRYLTVQPGTAVS
jgi:hypothetical protein